MTRKKLLLAATAAAVMAGFNPAFAGGAKHGSADDVSSPPRAEQEQGQPGTQSGPAVESAKMNAGASADAGVSAPDAGVSADANAGIGTTTEKSPSSNVQFGHSDTTLGGIAPQASAGRSPGVDPQTGLDRGHPAN